MNARERILAIAVLAAIVLAGVAVIAYQLFLMPIEERKRTLLSVNRDIESKQQRVEEIQAKRAKLAAWRQLSLPADINQARHQYVSYLDKLMSDSKFAPGRSISPKTETTRTSVLQAGRKTEPPFTKLVFDVTATATLDNLIDMLEQFYRTNLLHKIDKLIVTRQSTGAGPASAGGPQQRVNNLSIRMTIEALVLSGADKRDYLVPTVDRASLLQSVVTNVEGGPGSLAFIPWVFSTIGPLGPSRLAPSHREYAAIAGKNIFFGAEPVERRRDAIDVTQFVFLTEITKSISRTEAKLYNRYNNRDYRLRTTAGYNTFIIKDDDDETLVQGTIVRIDDRDVYFKDKDRYYVIHMGQSVKEAMRRPLKEEEIKVLGVALAKPANE